MDVNEIDDASSTGVDIFGGPAGERVRYASYGGGHKVYIIDEAHMLSTAAFNALLKTLEEPPAHVIFVLATTEPKKIPATVLSRCQHLPFRRISTYKIKERLRYIAGQENLKIADSAFEMVARAADGSMRDSLTILDQIASFSEDLSAEDVKDLLGFTDMQTLARLAEAVIQGDRKDIVDLIAGLAESGTDLKTFTKDYLQFMRDLLIARIVGNTEDIMDLSEEESRAIQSLSKKTNEEHLALLLTELIKAEPSIRSALFPRISLEMTLLRMSIMSHFMTVDDAIQMLGGTEPKATVKQSNKPVRSAVTDQDIMKEPQTKRLPVTGIKPLEGGANKKSDEIPVNSTNTAAAEVASSSKGEFGADLWKTVLERLENSNAPLVSKLREGSASVSKDGINILFNGGVAVLAESVKENLKLIQDTIKSVAGRPLPVRVETKEVKSIGKADLKEKALSNLVVREALELFDGRIADISQINDK